MSVVKWSRSAFFVTSSGSPGSWIGTSPRESDSTFSGTMSRAHTSWPSSAKQAAVTRPDPPDADDAYRFPLHNGPERAI